MGDLPRRVLKLGGSLLDWDGFPSTLRAWLQRQPTAEDWLICGGGQIVEALRDLDRAHGLGQEFCHWQSLRAMQITREVVARLLPEAQRCPGALPTGDAARQTLLLPDPWQLLVESEQDWPGERLPPSWDVTSDSIAARLAGVLRAELVLFKSAPPHGQTLASLVQSGYLDAWFERAVSGAAGIRLVDLRSGSETTVLTQGSVVPREVR